MKQIPLTKGVFATVDDIDFDWLNKWKWLAKKDGHKNNYYAYRTLRKSEGENPKKAIFMHRMLIEVPDGYMVDHVDGNGLNNCRSNLRLCTNSQNQHNRKPNKRSTSKYKGVKWNKHNNAWHAGLMCNKTKYNIGYFKDEAEAAKAYDKKAKELYGEFARLNFSGIGAAATGGLLK